MKVVTQTKSQITATLQEVLDLASKQYRTMAELPDDSPVSFDVPDVPKASPDRDYCEAKAFRLLYEWYQHYRYRLGLVSEICDDTVTPFKKTGRLL